MSVGLDARAALQLIGACGGNLWKRQRDIVRAVFGPRRVTSVQSCTASGKTHDAAWIIIAYMLTGRDRRVVTTAPTKRQVDSQVWTELRQCAALAESRGTPLGGKLPPKGAAWDIAPGWNAIGFSSTDDVNYAGVHSKGGTLVVIDDAQGIEDATWDTLKATLTGANDRLLVLGNPTRNTGRFFETCTDPRLADVVARVRISAFDTPNVMLGRTVIPGLVDVEAVNDARVYGEDSALWKTRILGEFPDEDSRALVPLAWIDASVIEWREMQALVAGVRPESIAVGADIARLGRDLGITSTVRDFMLRDTRTGVPFVARMMDPLVLHPKLETMGTAAYLKETHRTLRPSSFRVDAAGLGVGVFDRLIELGVPVIGMNGGGAANDRAKFVNARSEWLYGIREALRPNDGLGSDERPRLCLPPDRKLHHQLLTTLVEQPSDGRIKIESKDGWKARNRGASPDELDAVSMTLCAEPTGDGASVASLVAAYG